MSGGDAHNSMSGGTARNLIQAQTVGAVYLDGAPPPVAWEVPPPRPGFVNRTAELVRLNALLDRDGDRPGPRVLALCGLGGVGKSELLAQWVDRRAERFADGVLYVDLAEWRQQGAVEVGDVLAEFARSLGVHESYIRPTPAARRAVYRSATRNRRLLVFIDNADHAAEVRALLPASGVTVATSRNHLGGLRLDGADVVTVEPLAAPAAGELLRGWLAGGPGGDDEVAELVRLCGGLPLALRAPRPSRAAARRA
ncbi:ATP-binding protein [Streptomyces litchfieldiae]|uniref:ATP-binding protein n=1 Tax=Streptomyces litchfieldiae TaxID=3075543 RepID=A0ABU2MJA7_9ACTN|nr:ATP-binding protein [Streptomyces sp. DSM 44938]MDT0341565.1 ATP-binding protein [Streptomyces sp. DSM 44938]